MTELEGWYEGGGSPIPFDLDATAGNSLDAECHMCELPAVKLVELSQGPNGDNAVELGSAVYLCAECFAAVDAADVEPLADRNGLDISTREEIVKVATRIIEAKSRSANVDTSRADRSC